MARILERGITLVHTYSRNKSDFKDLIYFLYVFWKRPAKEIRWNESGLSIQYFSKLDSPFWAGKIKLQTKERKKNQIWVVRLIPKLLVIPLSRIRAYENKLIHKIKCHIIWYMKQHFFLTNLSIRTIKAYYDEVNKHNL